MLLTIPRALFDLLMPPICSVCGDPVRDRDETICDVCRAGFHGVGTLVCHRCGAPVVRKTNRRCPRCPKEPVYITSARSAFLYQGALRDAIHAFKYRHRFELGRPLARAMFVGLPAFSRPGKRVQPGEAPGAPPRSNPDGESRPGSGDDGDENELLPPPEVLIPVPMHFLRRLHRGYNHSEELAREFSALAGIPVRPRWLVRSRHTPRQALMPPERRQKNIFGAFTVTRPDAVRGCHVGLVDDVLTSGHTVNECARVLSEAGAATVQVLTLARA